MNHEQWREVPTTNEIAKSIELLNLNAQLVLGGRRRQVIVFGGAGCGKTFTISNALEGFRARGLAPIYCNPTGYKDILQAFVEAHAISDGKPSKARPVFFDEADTIFASEKCLNILKVALSPDRRQRIYHDILVDAPVFISTNKRIDGFSAAKRPHIEAVFDRQPPIVVPEDPHASWEYACYIALMTGMNRRTQSGDGISLAVQVRALEWFTENAYMLTVIGPRALHQIADTMAMRMPQWAEERELRTLLGNTGRRMNRSTEQHDWKDVILNVPRIVQKSRMAA